MRYMLVNISQSNLQIDIHSPDKMPNRYKLNLMGPEVALNIKRGESVDILPHFKGSLEKAHAAIKYSKDVLRLLKPTQLCIKVLDRMNHEIDVDKLLSVKAPVKTEKKEPIKAQTFLEIKSEVRKEVMKVKEDISKEVPAQYNLFTRETLMGMSKPDVLKAARLAGVAVNKQDSKAVIIDIMLGAQGSM